MIINYGYLPEPQEMELELNVESGMQVSIPSIAGAYTHNYIINWGDNTGNKTVTSYNDADATHTYTNGGVYKVILRGICETFFIDGASTTNNIKTALQKIKSFGNLQFKVFRLNGCTSLSELPEKIGEKSLKYINNFTNTFKNCTALTSIPEDLFRYSVNAFYFYNTFENCSALTSIPEKLFKYNINASEFNYTFYLCSNLASIPEDLFRYNINVTSFTSVFSFCGSITSIPTNLFKYNVDVLDFNKTFENTNITSIPADLFRYNILARSFFKTFKETSITSIPTDLFRYNTSVTNSPFDYGFIYTFENCYELTSIPTTLFQYNINIESFIGTFKNCSNLTSIPATLIDGLTSVYDLTQFFSGCDGITSAVPDWWNNAQYTEYASCFLDCTSASNYDSIPIIWKSNI